MKHFDRRQYLMWLTIPLGVTTLLFAAGLLAGRRPTLAQFLLPVAIEVVVVTLIFLVMAILKKTGSPAPPIPAQELVRRYLHEVRFWLPKQQRDDIVAELADDLRSRMEDRGEADVVAILKERGNPIEVASRYLPPRYLIGPALFPIYLFVVKLVVLWILVPIYAVVVGPLILKTSPEPALAALRAVWSLGLSSLFSVGVITIVMALIERSPHLTRSEWDPRQMPPVPAESRPDQEPMTWYRAVASILFSVSAALVWVYIAQPGRALEFEGVRIAFAPVWQSLFWPILVVMLSESAVGVAGLLRPGATRLHAAVRLAMDSVSLVTTILLIAAGTWVEITASGLPPARLAEAVKWTNVGFWLSLLIGAVATVAGMARGMKRVFGK